MGCCHANSPRDDTEGWVKLLTMVKEGMDVVPGEPLIDIFISRENANGSHNFDSQDLRGNGGLL